MRMNAATAPVFDVIADWEKLPADVSHKDVTGVAVDSKDRVYLFTRFPHRILIYNRDGHFIKSWGDDLFTMAHGLTIGPDDRVYCVDNGDHSIRVFTLDGEPVMTIGTPGEPSDTGYERLPNIEVHACECIQYPGGPFNRCTNLAVAPNGELYVADGYGNCRVHRFTADGELIQSWGEIGVGPGEFHLPHGIACDAQGRVLVCDRENDRIQIFSPDGEFLDQWTDIYRPSDLTIDADGLTYVAELWRPKGKKSFVHGEMMVDHPGRVSVLDDTGRVLDRWGGSSDERHMPGNFIAPHSIAIDSHGDVYVAEVPYSFALRPGWIDEAHADHQIQKFIRRS
ncbi:peptidyl-alpha-hydroxyglycine alpha-amidating lyase family protein [Parasphingorhabdus sp.]|uniref:peptidyl-alpha-hydroxyglycine alpha-amidating lyase family protein n=1 Tax=Parasphingorhabdus sp. TaxID=2709688 RepID=UPI003A8D75F6